MWYQIKSYLYFLLESKNQHAVHSPFIYDLITKCFYDKTNYKGYDKIQDFRDRVFRDNKIIEVTDFGAGSRVFKSNKRKVSAIAKNAGITFKRQKLLFRFVNYIKPSNILELGTSVGLGTSAMAIANSLNKIKTVEGCKNTSEVAQYFFNTFKLNNIQLYNSTFTTFFKENSSENYDLVYIDGNHNKENTLEYFTTILNNINNNSVLIFDDIYWSPKMTEAWQQIINHPKVTVSIDTFYWGFVFFRKEQQKQHFTIRL